MCADAWSQRVVFDDVVARIVYAGKKEKAPGQGSSGQWAAALGRVVGRALWDQIGGLFSGRGVQWSEYAAEVQVLATGESHIASLAKPDWEAWQSLKDVWAYGGQLYQWLFGPPGTAGGNATGHMAI